MTVMALDPKTALIVIDLQKGIVGLPTVHPIALSLEAHDSSVLRIFPRLGETGSTREIVDLLDRV
jgi:hypothetical protein